MTNSVIRQPSSPSQPVLRALRHGEAWPASLHRVVAEGLAQDHAFLRAVSAQWDDPSGPYSSPAAVFMVAFAEGAAGPWTDAVGLAGVVADPYLQDPRTGRLKHVYVSPAWRRRGLAEALVVACIARARGSYDRLRLRTDNPAAARLYERHGFEPRADEPESTHVLLFDR
jgi:ribosomal protein S18 acetylase RimI-like enzyme